MCSVDAQMSRSPIPATFSSSAPRYTGCKPPHALTVVVYDPAPAEQRANDAASVSADGAGAQLVPYVTPLAQVAELPIDAVPLAAAVPRRAPRVVDVPVEPWWIRERLFPHLKLRVDLPVHYIGEKAVTVTDLESQQNRFRLPTEGVREKLRPMLSVAELSAAHLLHDDPPKPKVPKKKVLEAAGEQLLPQGGITKKKKKKKKTGIRHDGLPVLVVNCNTDVMQMKLARWTSSRGTIIKGDGYMKFINASGLKEGDVVDIWAFKQRQFRYFGVTMCQEHLLCLVITKKEQHPAMRIA